MQPLMILELDTPVQYIKGVGPSRAEMFRSAGIQSVEDLLSWIPIRFPTKLGVSLAQTMG